MTLIKSISGIRGTIGGAKGTNLTPLDIVEFVSAYAQLIKEENNDSKKIVLGRDARISGPMVHGIVAGTLIAKGFEVIDLGLSTTPTVEMSVVFEKAAGGIILTASHNPKEWNALKFLNSKGEFISGDQGEKILQLIEDGGFDYASVNQLGKVTENTGAIQQHIDAIFALDTVDLKAIKEKNFKVVVDCINSSGAISIVPLLEQLNCEVIAINKIPNGEFAHNPEPLPEHLRDLSLTVLKEKAHLGIIVDPDVDRLAFVCEDGEIFGEEYTLVAISDYILKHKKGATVSNLSSTKALRDVTEKNGCKYYAAAVGEVNVVTKMKEMNAVIGGEGNGGIIYPELHYGRDALVGVALMLSHLAHFGKSISFLKATYPEYYISKNKLKLTPQLDVDKILKALETRYKKYELDTQDGLKIYIDEGWVHLRKSNTEPIIRIYSESTSMNVADNLANKIKQDINDVIKD